MKRRCTCKTIYSGDFTLNTIPVPLTGTGARDYRQTNMPTHSKYTAEASELTPGAQTNQHQSGHRIFSFGSMARERYWAMARVMLFVVWASCPLLTIVGHGFGLVSLRTSAMVVVPLSVMLAALMAAAPHRSDVIIRHGFVAGMIACVPYDVFRLSAVHAGHVMGDFIPKLGDWILGDSGAAGAAVGYLWRYLGDAAGAAVGFYVVAFTLGLHLWSRPGRIVLAAVGFAVFPVWTGLIGLVALAPHGQELMFRITPATVLVTLIGHILFGFVLGLAFVRARHLGAHLPWPPIPVLALRNAAMAAARRPFAAVVAPLNSVENLFRPLEDAC
jgi:hypothetical protein